MKGCILKIHVDYVGKKNATQASDLMRFYTFYIPTPPVGFALIRTSIFIPLNFFLQFNSDSLLF